MAIHHQRPMYDFDKRIISPRIQGGHILHLLALPECCPTCPQDTGLLYRAVGFKAANSNIPFDDEPQLVQVSVCGGEWDIHTLAGSSHSRGILTCGSDVCS